MIEPAISAYRRGSLERGRSRPIEIQETGVRVTLKRKHISNLCSWYLDNEIDAVELEYIADLIGLCADFEYDSTIEDALQTFSDPETTGQITPETVRKVQALLDQGI